MPAERSDSNCDPDSAKGSAVLRSSSPLKGENLERHISVQAIYQKEEFLWISGEPAETDAFPPCIRGMLSGFTQSKETVADESVAYVAAVGETIVVDAAVVDSTIVNCAVVESIVRKAAIGKSRVDKAMVSKATVDAKAAEASEEMVENRAKRRKSENGAKKEESENGRRGKYRTAAILAAFLGQAGFSRERAMQIWSQASDVETRIFESWFQKMHCPKCRAMQRQSRGYPDLGVADLGLCEPDEACQKFAGPVEYACRISSEEDQKKGNLSHIKTIHMLRFFDWSSGQEKEIELSQKEKEKLEALLSEKAGQKDKIIVYARKRVRGRVRPTFYLRDQDGPRRQVLSDLM